VINGPLFFILSHGAILLGSHSIQFSACLESWRSALFLLLLLTLQFAMLPDGDLKALFTSGHS